MGAGDQAAARTRREACRWSCRRPGPHHAPSLQELSKREVVAVGHLEVPAELAGLLQAVAGASVLDGVAGWAWAGAGAWHLMPSSLHRPQAGPGAPGGPRADSPAPG